jgi:hypothetical protein
MMVVPGRPSARALTFWVLTDTPGAPDLRLDGAGAVQAQLQVVSLAGPGDPALAQRIQLVTCLGLQPDQRYRLTVSRDGVFAEGWSRTFPERIAQGSPFTIALGSCFCIARNRGIDACYPPKLHATEADPIRFRVLAGDQLYMDSSESTGWFITTPAPKPFERYLSQWSKLLYATWLARSPNLMLADDHDFWNDYPHGSAWLLWSESKPNGPLGRAMDRAFSLFQGALNLEAGRAASAGLNLQSRLGTEARSFQLDVAPLSFFFLDTRTERSRYDSAQPHFCSPTNLARAVAWARALTGPGVLVLQQPLVETRAGALARSLGAVLDVNLPDYPADFRALWEAVSNAPHDVAVLAGDIHYTRLYSISREPIAKNRVYEIVSSPLARIPFSTKANDAITGKVQFGGGNARWTKFFAGAPEATYATVSFQPMSGYLRLWVRAWLVGEQGQAKLGWERTLTMK